MKIIINNYNNFINTSRFLINSNRNVEELTLNVKKTESKVLQLTYS